MEDGNLLAEREASLREVFEKSEGSDIRKFLKNTKKKFLEGRR